MGLRARLTVFIVTTWMLVATPMASAMAADIEAESTPFRITPSMVVDLLDDHGPGGDHVDHTTVGRPDVATGAAVRFAAAVQAAEIMADVKARLEAAPSVAPQQAREAQFTAAIAGRAGAAGFSVAYDPSFPTPSSAKAAIEAAVQTWDDTLDTDGAPVVVWVVWKSFGNSRILGSGGPYELRSRNDLPTGYYYPAPLVNTLTGADQNGSNPEVVIVLNKDLATSGAWHYGSGSPPGGKIDLQSVVLHEVGHGVGFVSSASNENGPVAFSDPPFIYDVQGVHQGGLVINAANVTTALTSGDVSIKIGNSQLRDVYAPSTWQQGTSYSHFEPDSGALMEPSLDSGATTRVVDGGTLGLLKMIGWPAALNVTGPPTVTSRALDGQIKRVYLAHLRRDPDNAGFTFWLNQRANGLSLLAMINEFQSSAEFVRIYGSLNNTQFVTLIYNNVLGRNPDSAGLAHWKGLLDGGTSRAEVTEGFIESTEFVRITGTDAPYSTAEGSIRRLYLAFFGREGASSDVAYWTGKYSGGTTLISIADYFSTSTEFNNKYGSLSDAQFVNLVYLAVLGRVADSAGFDFWMAQLDAGASRGEMMLEFSQSAEFVKSTGTIP